jgi:hypothetical protein
MFKTFSTTEANSIKAFLDEFADKEFHTQEQIDVYMKLANEAFYPMVRIVDDWGEAHPKSYSLDELITSRGVQTSPVQTSPVQTSPVQTSPVQTSPVQPLLSNDEENKLKLLTKSELYDLNKSSSLTYSKKGVINQLLGKINDALTDYVKAGDTARFIKLLDEQIQRAFNSLEFKSVCTNCYRPYTQYLKQISSCTPDERRRIAQFKKIIDETDDNFLKSHRQTEFASLTTRIELLR